MLELAPFIVHHKVSTREAFKQMDSNGAKFILVADDDKRIIGLISDGDLRRAIWNSTSLEDPVETIANRNFMASEYGTTPSELTSLFQENDHFRVIPILKDGYLRDLAFKEAYQNSGNWSTTQKIDLPVVIMAGGQGTRLDPFTRILPKPLIPIGNQPIIEIIMDHFAQYGMTNFWLSLHEKSRMIRAYFEDFGEKYDISYMEETEPLGTVGSLALFRNQLKSPFFVSNCDIVVDTDYTKIYEFHREGGHALTIVGSIQHYHIPYGVCEIDKDGSLDQMREKPEIDAVVNTGMYLFDPLVMDYIEDGKRLDINRLMEILKDNSHSIGVYPVSANSWTDVGQWEQYQNAVEKLNGVFQHEPKSEG